MASAERVDAPGRAWLHAATPASSGSTRHPVDLLRSGRIDRVNALLEHLASGG